jgi:hypothetical protein
MNVATKTKYVRPSAKINLQLLKDAALVGPVVPDFYKKAAEGASGKAGSADRVANKSFYSTIISELRITSAHVKLPSLNPYHKFSFEMINYCFARLDSASFQRSYRNGRRNHYLLKVASVCVF